MIVITSSVTDRVPFFGEYWEVVGDICLNYTCCFNIIYSVTENVIYQSVVDGTIRDIRSPLLPLLLPKKVGESKAERERFTPYQSKVSSPRTLTY